MKRLIFILIFVLTGCSSIFGPTTTSFVPPKSYQVDPLPIYERWHDEVKRCVRSLGIKVVDHDFSTINWFIVAGHSWINPTWGEVNGTFVPSQNIIYIAFTEIGHVWVIKHELLHFILNPQQEGDEHPSPPFHYCEYI